MAHIMCWACNGNGRDTRGDYCYQCNGTGCDEKKTRETKTMLESEKTYPKSLPMEPHEKYDIAKFIFREDGEFVGYSLYRQDGLFGSLVWVGYYWLR